MVAQEFPYVVALQTQAELLFGQAPWIFLARWFVFLIAISCVLGYMVEREPNHRHVWKELFWSVGVAFVMSNVLAVIIQRVRPFIAYPEQVAVWVPAPSKLFSFPSSHAAIAWAWVFSARKLFPSGTGLWVLSAILITLSRVVVGVHYPTDVLAGAIIGWVSYLIVQQGHRKLRQLTSL